MIGCLLASLRATEKVLALKVGLKALLVINKIVKTRSKRHVLFDW